MSDSDSLTTILLQILSLVASGGVLQFIVFLIKRSDAIKKLSVESAALEVNDPEIKTALEYQRDIASLKTKLRQCRKDLLAAENGDDV